MLEQRLAELEKEFELGQEQMAALDRQRAELRDTLLRISGAIQVLRELKSAAPSMAEQGAIPIADLFAQEPIKPGL